MKNLFSITVCILFSLPCFAREAKDSTTEGEIKWDLRFCFSGGINLFQYYNRNGFNDLANQTFVPTNTARPAGGTSSDFLVSNINLSSFNYNKLSSGPSINVGMNLCTFKFKDVTFHHSVELGYSHLTGSYSYLSKYNEDNSSTSSSVSWTAYVNDTIQSKYSQTMLSLGYKFEPTYKNIFLSVGFNCSLNLIRTEQQVREYLNGVWGSDLGSGKYSRNNVSENTSNPYYVNVPIQVGAGGYYKINNFILKPGFYFTSYFERGYNIYNLSLEILRNKN
jgi:hypothetical protein